MTTKKTKKKSRFVPRMILGSAAIVSVVPAVALIDCGSDDSSTNNGNDAGQFSVGQGVAVAAFFDAGEQDTGLDSSGFTVAVAATFDSGQDTGTDSATDAPSDGAEGEGGNDSGVG